MVILIVIFLFELVLCELVPVKQNKPTLPYVPAPDIRWFRIEDVHACQNSSIVIRWLDVESSDKQDPVIGFKLKVWEIHKMKRRVFRRVGEEFVSIDEDIYPEIGDKIFRGGIAKEYIIPANNTKTAFYDVQFEVAYDFSMLAFTEKGEGPLSSPVRIICKWN